MGGVTNPRPQRSAPARGPATGRGLGRRLFAEFLGTALLVAIVVGSGIGGALLANAMFAVPAGLSSTHRASGGHLIGEVVATAGLLVLIFALARTHRGVLSAPAVGAYIGAAYWFTSSTSFANPAVTVGRIFSDTFAGIAPASVLAFIAMQIIGGAVGVACVHVLYPDSGASADEVLLAHPRQLSDTPESIA